MSDQIAFVEPHDAYHFHEGEQYRLRYFDTWTFSDTSRWQRFRVRVSNGWKNATGASLHIVEHVDRVNGCVMARRATRWERFLWVIAFPGRWVRRRFR